jgi:hypothetical protein
MAARQRKIRSDSASGERLSFEAAATPIEPPQRLGKKAMFYFEAIAERRAREEWFKLDLIKACTLAKLYVERDVEERKMRRDKGAVVGDARGSKRNPRDMVLVQRENLIMRMEKHLRLHSNADHKDVSQIRAQRANEQAARAALEAANPRDGPDDQIDPAQMLLPVFNINMGKTRQ